LKRICKRTRRDRPGSGDPSGSARQRKAARASLAEAGANSGLAAGKTGTHSDKEEASVRVPGAPCLKFENAQSSKAPRRRIWAQSSERSSSLRSIMPLRAVATAAFRWTYGGTAVVLMPLSRLRRIPRIHSKDSFQGGPARRTAACARTSALAGGSPGEGLGEGLGDFWTRLGGILRRRLHTVEFGWINLEPHQVSKIDLGFCDRQRTSSAPLAMPPLAMPSSAMERSSAKRGARGSICCLPLADTLEV